MPPTLAARRDSSRSRLLATISACLLVTLPGLAAWAKLETWRDDSASAFGKGRRDRLVVSEAGRVRLGHGLKSLGSLEAARVWDLARGPGGEVFAATGDQGKVFRLDPKEGSSWTLAYDAGDSQALALAVLPGGGAFVGTGPSGQVVEMTAAKPEPVRPGPGVQYVWDLAADAQGNLFAATGPEGQLWKRSPQGAWTLAFDSRHAHLLSLAVGADGSVYAGSDGDGVVYKVAPGGKVSVVFDAPQAEIRSLLIRPDGTLFAGTASESGGGPGRAPGLFSGGANLSSVGGGLGERAVDVSAGSTRVQDPPPRPSAVPKDESPRGRSGGSSSPRPASGGENAVYRIDREGAAVEVFRARVLMFALALRGDALLVGTGPEGQLYEVRDDGRDTAPVAKLDNGHILSLLAEPGGGILVGAADPGAVVRLERGYVDGGTITSEVHDTKLISRFGSVGWRADLPAGTSLSIQVRSGNVAEADATWSEWSSAFTDPSAAQARIPAGRFVQYRASLGTKDPAVSPELSSVFVRYQSLNLPPEIVKLEVPDVSALDGVSKPGKLTFKWDVNDPNDDDLAYSLYLRKEGWPDWVKLNEESITDRTFPWDSTSVPAGRYQVRLTATDRPSNNQADALSRERVSESFLIDHEAPAVVIKSDGAKATVSLRDSMTRIVRASYAIDGGEWVPVFADDGLFDTTSESLTIPLSGLKPGHHVVMVRAYDAAGNPGTGDALAETR